MGYGRRGKVSIDGTIVSTVHSRRYYRDASIAILVYDVSDDKSFQSMDYWLKELEEKR